MKNLVPIFFYAAVIALLPACTKVNLKKQCCDNSANEIYLADKNIQITVPNVITPNGDLYNESFYYMVMNNDLNDQSIPNFNTQIFKVYNGNTLVYQTNDYQNDFTGNDSGGKVLSEGRYKYELYLDDNFVKGYLCIIRSKEICTDQCRPIDSNDPLLISTSCE